MTEQMTDTAGNGGEIHEPNARNPDDGLPAEANAETSEQRLPSVPETHLSRALEIASRAGNFGQMMEIAKVFAQSDAIPKQYRGKPGDVLVAAELGAGVGLPIMAALQNIASINGRPALYGDGLLAVVKARGGVIVEERIHGDDGKQIGWKCTSHRRGHPPVEHTFTLEDAKAAALESKDGPWKLYPLRMCQMRARSWACRDQYPDWLSGLAVYEEAHDIIDITPGGDVQPASTQSGGSSGVLQRARQRRESSGPAKPSKTDDGPQFSADEIARQIETAESVDAVNEAMSIITSERPHLADADYSKLMRSARERVKALAQQ